MPGESRYKDVYSLDTRTEIAYTIVTPPPLPRTQKGESKKENRMILRIVFLLLVTVSVLFGQTNATIRGLITDQSGAVLPGAAINVRNQGTGVERTTLSDETGNYQV